MATLLQKIARLAVTTFRRDPRLTPGAYKTHYDQLSDLLARITPADLKLDPALLQDRGPFNPRRDGAPVTYMQIYEDLDVTICVFILKRGVRLPLHDHPGMCGLLKVVHGAVSIQSYSFLGDGNGQQQNNGIPHPSTTTTMPSHHQGLLAATKHPTIITSANDPACRLSPGENNLHEIHSLNGTAAFLDILSPPYGMDDRLGYERDCHYYRELDILPPGFGGGLEEGYEMGDGEGSSEGPTVLLCRVETPSDFWCDQAEFKGPPVLVDGNNGSL
ncbi:2-aminoethanethiol dioxygenase-like [Eriocheir sinensis]|uniref:2-aminoethanethiol dioxygenase-like n=1 Tax=Eriocheir sinensis TaxID=95602 RepID=UPI0021C716BF|nr:2-aminoethanethiol dioxygenase-like [Eriocheir sinensis]